MKTSTAERKHEIQWRAWLQIDDSNFIGVLVLLSHTYEQMRVRTISVAEASASVGLNIHKGKSKILKYNTENANLVTLEEENLEELENFMQLDSIIDEQGGSDEDIKARIGEARAPFLQLKNM
ncbi:unnamed protein product [Schistosoma margrebowiei]|uniref:Uncharacterized protein n=1 Tax=Schistosoma margrebowiei TaxID=48269 RepID=A0A183LLB1_9TREM|nr:unnamed protein product [Schistosoma margrebowiei]